jgi:hypothetical protein
MNFYKICKKNVVVATIDFVMDVLSMIVDSFFSGTEKKRIYVYNGV